MKYTLNEVNVTEVAKFSSLPVARAVTDSGVGGLKFTSRTGQIGHMVPTTRHRCNISSNGAVLPGRSDAGMGPANTLHASA